MERTKKEFLETKESLYLTLADKLKEVVITKEELEEHKEQYVDLLDKMSFDEVLQRVNIFSKLGLINKEISIHQSLDNAIEFLDLVIEKLKGELNGKGA